jgi:hypothetical protein
MSTRAQIGFYDSNDLSVRPDALVYQHSDGHPTGSGGMVSKLIDICVPLIKQRGTYDSTYLAAQTLYRLIDQYDRGVSGLGFGIDLGLHGDTRFYYAVTSDGVYVFDARTLDDDDLDNLSETSPMFFTAWVDDEKRRTVEKDIAELEARLKNLYLNRESIKRRVP